jgi:hypothetical protein
MVSKVVEAMVELKALTMVDLMGESMVFLMVD